MSVIFDSKLSTRFWSKVGCCIPNKCWEWIGAKSDRGYGRFWFEGSRQPAHRVAYTLMVGKIPKGNEVDHLCRNHSCVNPKHLEVVSHKENCSRGLVGLNNRFFKTSHCINGHEFTPENTRIRSNGSRNCRTCQREHKQQYQKNHKAIEGEII